MSGSGVTTVTTDACAFTSVDNYSVSYHVGAVFIILVASLLGTGIPIIGAYFPKTAQYPFIYICGKHIGTGVLLSLSLIHLLAPAFSELGSTCLPYGFQTYQYAPLFALLSAIMMHFMETVAFDLTKARHIPEHTHTPPGATEHIHDNDHNHSHSHDHHNEQIITNTSSTNDHTDIQPAHHNDYNEPVKHEHEPTIVKPDQLQPVSLQGVCIDVHAHDHNGHVHGMFVNIDVAASIQKTISAYLLEFGLTAHSVIIGITVGVADDTTTNTLLAALVFHQFFEGFALGARLKSVGFSKYTEALLASIYSTAAPLGIAIGIGIVGTYNGSGEIANLVQGIFDAVSAGIILYVAFVQMLGGDFSHDYAACGKSYWKKIALWICMWTGATVMAVIGIWL